MQSLSSGGGFGDINLLRMLRHAGFDLSRRLVLGGPLANGLFQLQSEYSGTSSSHSMLRLQCRAKNRSDGGWIQRLRQMCRFLLADPSLAGKGATTMYASAASHGTA